MEKLASGTLTLLILLAFACNDQKQGKVTPVATPNQPAARYLEEGTTNYFKVWSYMDTLLYEKLTSSTFCRNVNGSSVSQNSEELLKTVNFWHRALPDLKISAEDIVVVGNKTYVTWTLTGTNTGMFGDNPPTGKKGRTQGFSVLTFDDNGKLMQEAAYFDVFTLMTDWGYSVVPPIMK